MSNDISDGFVFTIRFVWQRDIPSVEFNIHGTRPSIIRVEKARCFPWEGQNRWRRVAFGRAMTGSDDDSWHNEGGRTDPSYIVISLVLSVEFIFRMCFSGIFLAICDGKIARIWELTFACKTAMNDLRQDDNWLGF